jgi:large subunit ribosomal protein L30
MSKIKITQVRSAINRLEKQKRTIRALGIRKLQQSVVHEDTPQIRGMLRVVAHLVEVEEVKP